MRALGEMVWATWDRPRSGSFGMRFLELDTKSGTAIRRYAAADTVSVEQPIPARGATMRIDGLEAPIDADVRLLRRSFLARRGHAPAMHTSVARTAILLVARKAAALGGRGHAIEAFVYLDQSWRLPR